MQAINSIAFRAQTQTFDTSSSAPQTPTHPKEGTMKTHFRSFIGPRCYLPCCWARQPQSPAHQRPAFILMASTIIWARIHYGLDAG